MNVLHVPVGVLDFWSSCIHVYAGIHLYVPLIG